MADFSAILDVIIHFCNVFFLIHSEGIMKRHRRDERGQGLVEYGMILILVAVVVIVVLAVLGPGVGNLFSNVVSGL